MLRLIHTADVHLDACFAGSWTAGRAAFGNRRRQSLRDVFQSIVRYAGDWPADALLIAGDLFEAEHVTRDTTAFIRTAFDSIPGVSVFIAPGNHDPYQSDSPYARESWPRNVHIFTESHWTARELSQLPLTVHGFGFDGPDVSHNPYGELAIPEDGRIHVAIGHGSERSHQPPEKNAYAPFDAASAAPPGLAYLALGHFHARTAIEGPFDTRAYYSGAPEGLSFREPGPHHFLAIEIDDTARHAVRVTPVASSRVVYDVQAIDCSSFETTQQVVEAIRAVPREPSVRHALRVALTGAPAFSVQSNLGAIHDALAAEFECLDLADDTEPAEDYEALARDTTSLGAFVRKLNQQIRDATDDARRRLLERAREVGVAAYRGQEWPIRGAEDAGT